MFRLDQTGLSVNKVGTGEQHDVATSAEYLAWLSEGNIPEPYVPPPPEPVTQVTALQGLLAIDHAGLSLEYTLWANSPLRTFAQKAFIDKAQVWKRDDPTLVAAATDLGISSDQLDALFMLASNL